MELKQIEQIAIEIAREAGGLLRQGYGQRKEINSKSSAIDLVTQYDTAAEALIAGRLQTAFPTYRLLGEEGGEQNHTGSSRIWYVDPLDGTNNFAHGFPVFCVSLALYDGNQPLVGVIYDPLRDECFHGAAGLGAYLTNASGQRTRLQVGQAATLTESLLATGFPYDRHTSAQDNITQLAAFLKRAQGLRRAGSAALDLAYVAAGRLDGYWEYKLSPWDVAAGVLLVQEASGRVTDVTGHPLVIAADKLSLIAANDTIHPQMWAILQQLDNQPAPIHPSATGSL